LADEVRAAQTKLGFGDGAAHRMALLAMDQLAWAIAGLRSGFEVGDTEDALRRTLGQGRVAVWAPYSLVANRSDIPQSWTVTSDSVALWLGRRPAPSCCVIVIRERAVRAEQLARDGVVDKLSLHVQGLGFPRLPPGRSDRRLAMNLSLGRYRLAQPSTNGCVVRRPGNPVIPTREWEPSCWAAG
jgi:hypothetical protein